MTGVDVGALTAALRSLLPEHVHCAVMRCEDADPALLHDEERILSSGWSEARIQEFAAGRLLARRIMKTMGREPRPLLVGDHRQPLWPGKVLGSITHSGGLVAVAAAPRGPLLGLGIDMESAGVSEQAGSRILSLEERSEAAAQGAAQGEKIRTLMYSARESFYKAQFAITGRFLGYDALRVSVPQRGRDLVFDIRDRDSRDRLKDCHIALKRWPELPWALTSCVISRL